MAVIYLSHPVHGAKVAMSDMEAAYDMLHGWEPFEPVVATPAPQPVQDEPAPPAPVVAPANAMPLPKRRARKP